MANEIWRNILLGQCPNFLIKKYFVKKDNCVYHQRFIYLNFAFKSLRYTSMLRLSYVKKLIFCDFSLEGGNTLPQNSYDLLRTYEKLP